MRKKPISHILTLLLLLLAHSGSAFAAPAVPAEVRIDFTENETEWTNAACQFMTEGGCAYFRAYEAEPAWLALKAMHAVSVTILFQEVIADFGSDLALWRLELSVTSSSGESETHEVYATILAQNGQALLDRVIVFDQTLTAKTE